MSNPKTSNAFNACCTKISTRYAAKKLILSALVAMVFETLTKHCF